MHGPDPAHSLRLAADPRRGVPALFLDRDGTVIDDPGYIDDPAAVRLIPGAVPALQRFAAAGFALVIVTNQSGIGRGYYGWADYDAVAARLRDLLAAEGVRFDAELACGHAPEARCAWRKPGTGMILAAAEALALDLPRSLLAGDKRSDLDAAAAAGVPRVAHVLTGHGAAERPRLGRFPGGLRVDLLDDLGGLVP